jgi:hypothetical protein
MTATLWEQRDQDVAAAPIAGCDVWRELGVRLDVAQFTPRLAKNRPYILELFGSEAACQALVVEDALFCGSCTPWPEPVELPNLA